MTKSDKWLLASLIMITAIFYGAIQVVYNYFSSDDKQAVIYFYDQEIARYDMNVNQTHTHQGLLGEVVIEIKDKKIRVEKETSPYHYCSLQGWQDQANLAIVCLPNGIWIKIENKNPHTQPTQEIDTVIG